MSDRAPRELRDAGRGLWREVHRHLSLDAHEERLLFEACRTADHLDALAEIISREGVMRDGKPHPALVEKRQQQVTFARLIATLRLPEDMEAPAARPQRRGAARGIYDKRLRAVGED